MSSPYRSTSLPLAGALLLAFLLGIYLFASKRLGKKPAVARHRVKTSPAEALKYWTEEKRRGAKPAEMPHVDTGIQSKPDQESPRS